MPHIQHDMAAEHARRRALQRARRVLESIQGELAAADWYSEGWLDEVFSQVARNFDQACERWRNLYRAALSQRETQNRIIGDASRTPEDRAKARRLRQEAESQLELLTQGENLVQADFYSYRYFASEGFLPGYSFPRLPLSAFIPGRQRQKGRDEFLSRSRFLAISEFGPQSIVYHEGSKYKINKVILPVVSDDLLTGRAKLCPQCGYLHPIAADPDRICAITAVLRCAKNFTSCSACRTSPPNVGRESIATRRSEFVLVTTFVPPCVSWNTAVKHPTGPPRSSVMDKSLPN